jgi:N-acetylglucosamine malate deacetylase 1
VKLPFKEATRLLVARYFAKKLARRSRELPPFSGPLLVIAPHPDDETLGCGGLIARQLRARAPVHVVFITNGEASHRGHPTMTAEEVARSRRAEALAALEVLGATDAVAVCTFLAAPDGKLDRLSAAESDAVLAALREKITRLQPQFICAPYQHGGSSEHTAVFSLVESACRTATDTVLLEYPVWAWWNAVRFRPQLRPAATNFRLVLGELRTVKRAALACHRSQTEPAPPWPDPGLPPSLVAACTGPNEFYFRTTRPIGKVD